MANEAADATEATEADEADANVADEAEANYADGAANEANVAEKADVIDEIDTANEANVANETEKANEPLVRQGQQVDEANNATADKPLIQRDQHVEEAIVVKDYDGTAKANDVTNTGDELDELDEADGADISDELPFSLTKCSEAFFSEDKANFGIHVDVCNNKLLVARSRDELDKLVEAKGTNNNQL